MKINAATTEDLRDANKSLKFAKMNNDVELQFRPLGQISDMVLVAMSDASWGIRREGHSQGGYLLMLAHASSKRNPGWSSHQLHHFGLAKLSFAPRLQKLIVTLSPKHAQLR